MLRLKRVRNPDAVALEELEHFLLRLKARGLHVLMCGVHSGLHGVMERVGMVERVGEPVFLEQRVRQTSTMRAIEQACSLIEERCPQCPWNEAPRLDAPPHG